MRNQLLLSILVAVVAVLGYNHFVGPRVITVVEYETIEIDEDLWVSRSQYLSERDLVQQLREENSRFVEQLEQNRQRLLQSSQVQAQLRLEIDRLKSIPHVVEIIDNRVDTTFTYTFNDSLLAVHARVTVDSTRLSHNVELEQLRPIELQAFTTQSVEGVLFYVESRDLEITEIKSFTTIDNPRYKWYHYVGLGFVSGLLVWELVR